MGVVHRRPGAPNACSDSADGCSDAFSDAKPNDCEPNRLSDRFADEHTDGLPDGCPDEHTDGRAYFGPNSGALRC